MLGLVSRIACQMILNFVLRSRLWKRSVHDILKMILYLIYSLFDVCFEGHSDFTTEVSKLFKALDSENTGFIWWEQLLDRLLECGEKRTSRYPEGWTPIKKDKIKIQDLPHCKVSFKHRIKKNPRNFTWAYFGIQNSYGSLTIFQRNIKLLLQFINMY